MKSLKRFAPLLLPIIFLSACSSESLDSPDLRWKEAYASGTAAHSSGDLKKAEENFRISLAALSGQSPSQKRAESSLALACVLMEKRDCAGALPNAQEAMVFFQGKWSPLKSSSSLDDTGSKYLGSMLLVARALNCQHRYSESLPLLKRIRALQENVIVPVKFNHDLTDALSQALIGSGKEKEAHRLRDDIRFTESSVASTHQIDVGSLTFEEALKEGKSAHQGGNFASAEKLLKHAVDEAKREDEQSMKTAEALLCLGDVQCSKGNYTAARPMMEKALKIARRQLPKDDRALKDYMKRLASLYANQSEWKKAAMLDEEALELIFDDEYKHDKHAHRSRDLMDALIDIYKKDGQLDKAEKMARRKISLEVDAYGKDSRKVGLSYCVLADILGLKKQHKEAEKYFRSSLEILKHSKKTDPRDLNKAFSTYGHYLDQKGDKAGAKRLRDDENALNAELVDGLAGKDR
jgi:tetratricopeptide (TPR) repeat protein